MIRTEKRMRICTALLTCILAFIWGNSMLPRAASESFSFGVQELLEGILSGERDVMDVLTQHSGFVQRNDLLRKIAHVVEFGVLGACLGWRFGMLEKGAHWPILLGIGAAAIDETIQIITPNRGPSLWDVGIDACGVMLGLAALHMGLAIWKRGRQTPSRRKDYDEKNRT